jgi:hypothetical protein
MIPATSSRSRASSIGSSLQRSTSTRDGSSRWAAGSWAKIAEAFPEAFVLDVTATPERLEGRGLAMRSTRWWSGPASPISSIWDSWRVRPPMRANRQIFSGVSIGNGNYDVAQIAAISPAPPSWVTRSSIAPQKWVPRSIVGATEIRQEPGHPGQMVAWRGAANLLRGAAPRGVRPSPAEPRFYCRAWSIQGQNEPCRCGCDLKRLKR